MIKWIQQYFQNKADARKNMMVPTRKPSVRINLKKVKFNRGPVGPASQPKAEPPTSAKPQRQARPSLTSPDSLRSSAFKTEGIKQKVYGKPKFSYTMLTFAGAILFFLVAMSYVYVNSQSSQRQDFLDQCRSSFTNAIQQGIDLGGVNCKTKEGLLSYLQVDEAEQKLNSIKTKIVEEQALLENSNQDLDQEILQTVQYLSYFELDPTLLPAEPLETEDIQAAITNKQEYLAKLQSLLEAETGTIQKTISNYGYLIETNPGLDLSTQKAYLDDFVGQEQDIQYQNYSELVIKFNELVQTISEDQDNQFVAPGLAREDAFDYKFFSGEEFKQQWYRVPKPDTSPITDSVITGDNAADRRIIQIATDRGYQLQVQASADVLVSVENELLHPIAATAYEALKSAALEDGISLGLVSGFRSPDTQQDIFTSRLNSAAVSVNGDVFDVRAIAAGEADEVIDSVLQTSSIPGYSKHHTGLTLDFTDLGSVEDFTEFKNTQAFAWLNANNYYNAKRFGFIPSYPEGALLQGPEPEAWEYVYVGVDVLK